jgi:hypothetical protein
MVKCPDGTTRIIYKNIDKAFPLHIPGWDGKINASIEAIKGSPANLAAEYQSKIQGLLFSLDELNQNLMLEFRTVYISFQSNPCKNSDSFERQVEKMIHEQTRLTQLRIQIRGLTELAEMHPDNREQIIHIFKNIVHQIGGKEIAEAASEEISEAREEMKKLKGGSHVS